MENNACLAAFHRSKFFFSEVILISDIMQFSFQVFTAFHLPKSGLEILSHT